VDNFVDTSAASGAQPREIEPWAGMHGKTAGLQPF
jgi:hypothetical protein